MKSPDHRLLAFETGFDCLGTTNRRSIMRKLAYVFISKVCISIVISIVVSIFDPLSSWVAVKVCGNPFSPELR